MKDSCSRASHLDKAFVLSTFIETEKYYYAKELRWVDWWRGIRCDVYQYISKCFYATKESRARIVNHNVVYMEYHSRTNRCNSNTHSEFLRQMCLTIIVRVRYYPRYYLLYSLSRKSHSMLLHIIVLNVVMMFQSTNYLCVTNNARMAVSWKCIGVCSNLHITSQVQCLLTVNGRILILVQVILPYFYLLGVRLLSVLRGCSFFSSQNIFSIAVFHWALFWIVIVFYRNWIVKCSIAIFLQLNSIFLWCVYFNVLWLHNCNEQNSSFTIFVCNRFSIAVFYWAVFHIFFVLSVIDTE